MEALKNIGAYSPDAIAQCIERTLEDEEKQIFLDIAEKVSFNLGEPSKVSKRKKSTITPKIPTKQEIFKNSILPQIKRNLRQYEQDQLNNRQIQLSDKVWNEKHFHFHDANLDEMQTIHEELLKQERVAGARHLFTKFNRGLFYLAVYEKIMDVPNITDWFPHNLNVPYSTAMRYIVLASLIRRCPALLVCDLTFDQLVFHSDSINNYLSEEQEGLKEKLSVAVQLVNGRDVIKVEAGEMQIPGIKFTPHPDYQFVDSIETDEGVESWNKWIEERRQAGELNQIMYPPESVTAMESIIRTMGNLSIPPGRSIESRSVLSQGRGRGIPALPPSPKQ